MITPPKEHLAVEDGGGGGADSGTSGAADSGAGSSSFSMPLLFVEPAPSAIPKGTTSADIAGYPWPIGVKRGPGHDRPAFVSRWRLPKNAGKDTMKGFAARLLDPDEFDQAVYGTRRRRRAARRRQASKS